MKNVIKISFLFVMTALTVNNVFSQSQDQLENEEEEDIKRFYGQPSSAMVDDESMDMTGFAEEDFRRGVQAYYRGSFNESILQFEKALSYLPGENLILDWLGKAYYRSGIEGEAIQQWQFASSSGYGGLLLQNRIEVVRERRVTGADAESSLHFTESGNYPGKFGENFIFSQPVSILPNTDGTIWLLAYSSNELLLLDVNGNVISRYRGPLNGFDRPMDIVRAENGNMLVSEYAGNRITVLSENGSYISSFGEKGRGVGQFMGPQYIAQDSVGNVYVTDFGNARVGVFDNEGKGLFHFGTKDSVFAGLKGPTGIAIVDDNVFVADCVTGAIYRFDRAGNYEGLLTPEHTFRRPEAMKKWGKYLIIADANKVISIDTVTGATFENASTGNAPSRITSAVPDINGNILVTDIKNNEICVMSNMTELVGGLFVQIEKVVADEFPKVQMEVRVENRKRQPVVGLKAENFFITEQKRPVVNQELTGSAYSNDNADFTLLIDRSIETADYAEALKSAVTELVSKMKADSSLRIVSAGNVPATEYVGSPSNLGNFAESVLKNPSSDDCAIDLGIRLAANDLINAQKKRAIIFLTAGSVGQNSFSKYSLSDLTSYLNNNGISFSVIQLKQGSLSDEVKYIANNTMGESYYVYRPEGLANVVQELIDVPSGLYSLSYTSALPTNFGRAYLPVEIETYLLNRSGRDESGYFAPLQ